jgi:hypothetical protein
MTVKEVALWHPPWAEWRLVRYPARAILRKVFSNRALALSRLADIGPEMHNCVIVTGLDGVCPAPGLRLGRE